MIGKGYVVEDDLFGIARRIRAFDPDYFVFYSYEKKRYEVHSKGQKGSTLAVALPYPALDERAFAHVVKTRVENAAALMEEIDRENVKAEKNAVARAVYEAELKTERALRGKEI